MPGTGSPFIAVWPSVREVEKPSAPASIASCTIRAIASMSSGVAGSLRAPRSPIAYVRTEPWATCTPKSIASSRRPTASRYSGKDSQPQVMPSVRAVPGMSSTPSISSMSSASPPGRTGAKPTPQLPDTMVVTPCRLDGSSSGSQVTWPS